MPRPSRFRLLVLAALAALAVSSATFAAEPTRLPRENLLVYRAATGAATGSPTRMHCCNKENSRNGRERCGSRPR